MKMLESWAKLLTEPDPMKKIELAGRTCYKSEDKITADSAAKFVKNLMARQHYAMLEHAWFVFIVENMKDDPERVRMWDSELASYIDEVNKSPYLNGTYLPHEELGGRHVAIVSGNVRAINDYASAAPLIRVMPQGLVYEGAAKLMDESFPSLQATIIDPSKAFPLFIDWDEMSSFSLNRKEIFVHGHMTFRVQTDRGVTHEMVRHRPASYAQESTRYVNYLEGITISLPVGFEEKSPAVQELYQEAFEHDETIYRQLIELGEKPQQARAVLPTALKTEIVMTTNLKEWTHFFNLRMLGTTGAPHPDMKDVATKMFAASAEAGPTVAEWRETYFPSVLQ